MSDAPTNPHESHPRPRQEYEDPHYHDEDPDIQQDEARRAGAKPPAKRKTPRKLPPTPRRHYED
jgi:hypothetical protein